MPSLQVRDLPEHIYRKLLEDARRQHRSLAQQAVVTLSRGLQVDDDPRARRRKLVARISSGGLHIQDQINDLRNPTEIIREDRER